MQYRLLDTSCIINCFTKEEKILLLNEIINKKYFFYVPQFCVAEFFNTINKWYYRKDNGKAKITLEQANKLINSFIYLVHNRNYLYVYDLHRYHNLNCNKIFSVEHTTPKKNRSYLSTFDILVIAMGYELQLIHGKDNFSIISADERLVEISNKAGIKATLY